MAKRRIITDLDRADILEAIGACRQRLVLALSTLRSMAPNMPQRPRSRTRSNDAAEVMTGDREAFWAKAPGRN